MHSSYFFVATLVLPVIAASSTDPNAPPRGGEQGVR